MMPNPLFLVILMLASIASLSVIYWYRDDIEYPQSWARVALFILGASTSFFGFSLMSNPSLLINFLGAASAVVGTQVALWSLGIRFDLLATREVGIETSAVQQRPMLQRPMQFHPKLLEHFTVLLERFAKSIEETDQMQMDTLGLLLVAKEAGFDSEVLLMTRKAAVLAEQIRLRRLSNNDDVSDRKSELLDILAELKVALLVATAEGGDPLTEIQRRAFKEYWDAAIG